MNTQNGIAALKLVVVECDARGWRAAADAAFADYDWGDEYVKDTGGWQQVGPDEWDMPVYLEPGDGPSDKVMFVVRFGPGTSKVSDRVRS